MDAQNKLRKITDAHRHRSKLSQLDAEIVNVDPGEEVGGTTLTARGVRCLSNSSLQTKGQTLFLLFS